MSHSSLLDSFDPFAIHPFTNSCGVPAQPPSPSTYPTSIPSAYTTPREYSRYTSPSTPIPISTSPSSPSSPGPATPLRSPQPQRHYSGSPGSSPTSPTSPRHVFVPFRKDTSSPDLVLKKRSPTAGYDALARMR